MVGGAENGAAEEHPCGKPPPFNQLNANPVSELPAGKASIGLTNTS